EVYYEGSPMVRGEFGKMIVWTVVGFIVIAVPFLWHFLAHKPFWPWWVIAGLVILGLVLIVVPTIIVRQVRYRISNYRIDYEKGLLGKTIETLELWHVDDIEFKQSFFVRI